MLKIEIVRTRQVEMGTNMPTQAFCPRWGKETIMVQIHGGVWEREAEWFLSRGGADLKT